MSKVKSFDLNMGIENNDKDGKGKIIQKSKKSKIRKSETQLLKK